MSFKELTGLIQNIVESQGESNAFVTHTETKPKQTLLDSLTTVAKYKGALPQESDNLKHTKMQIGDSKVEGWGADYHTLDDAFTNPKTVKAHQKAIEAINTEARSKGIKPVSIQSIHVKYAPGYRAVIHLSNGIHNFGMIYKEGASVGSGQRYFVKPDGSMSGSSYFSKYGLPFFDTHTPKEHNAFLDEWSSLEDAPSSYTKELINRTTPDIRNKVAEKLTGNIKESDQYYWKDRISSFQKLKPYAKQLLQFNHIKAEHRNIFDKLLKEKT